jgi:hypothetical protein
MPILDQYGNPISSAMHRFANSANRTDRSHPPEPLFLDDFDRLIPDMDRKALLSGSRKMFQNFGPSRGAIIQKADNVIGRAWLPKFTGQDKEWGALAKDWLVNQWYGMCDVRGPDFDFQTLLWLDCVAVDRDGDFLILFEESETGYPLTRRISANRIGQRSNQGKLIESGPFRGRPISQGVIFGDKKRPLAYRILGDTPAEDVDVPAANCIRVMDPMWHDQTRGEPGFANALKFIRSSLLSHEWEQMAQLMVSSIGLIEYNETGGPDMDDPGFIQSGPSAFDSAAPSTEILQNGTVRYFRSNSGGKLEQLEHTRPGDMWDRFQDRVIRIAMSGINWPYELVWKANEINAALVRNIQERARLSIEDRQDTLRRPAMRTLQWAVAKAIKEKILPQPKTASDWWHWDFSMPRKFSVDAGRDAAQRREDFKIGFRNRAQIISEEGFDEEQMEDERIEAVFRYEKKIREREEREGFPVDRRHFQMMTPNDQPMIATGEDEEGEQQTPEEND